MSDIPDGETAANTSSGYDGAYTAHLWEYPNLCVALFGVQFHTPEGQRRYEASGIPEEMNPVLQPGVADGLLLVRPLGEEGTGLLLQYWRTYEDLDRWARQLPHMRWWRWLLENVGPDLSFYHEIYQVKAAEAIYERSCRPVGPAAFAATSPVIAGEGRSKDRQARFVEAAAVTA
jgi:hypothetical protein